MSVEPMSYSTTVRVSVGVRVGCIDKSFNLGHNIQTVKNYRFHMCIPYGKTFHMVPYFLDLDIKFDLLWKNFNLGHNFQNRRDRAFILHITKPSTWYHNFWSCDLDLEVWPPCENFNLGCYLMKVAARQASLPSDNSYYVLFQEPRS